MWKLGMKDATGEVMIQHLFFLFYSFLQIYICWRITLFSKGRDCFLFSISSEKDKELKNENEVNPRKDESCSEYGITTEILRNKVMGVRTSNRAEFYTRFSFCLIRLPFKQMFTLPSVQGKRED